MTEEDDEKKCKKVNKKIQAHGEKSQTVELMILPKKK